VLSPEHAETLVLRPGALGDTLLALPAVRALRRRGGRVTLAAHGGTARLVARLGEVDVGLAFDDPRLGWVFGAGAPPRPRPRVVAWLDPGAGLAIRPEVLAASRPADDQTHCASHLLDSVCPGCPVDDHVLDITPRVCDEVLVHPGSGARRKNWPAERFAAVVRALEARGIPTRLVVGEADLADAQAVEACVGHALPRLEHPSLEALAARLAGCRAYLGNDSGVSHLAGLAGARTVVLFGPTPAAVWRPLGPRVSVLDFSADPVAVVEALQS
jgi:heptosyltransferase III